MVKRVMRLVETFEGRGPRGEARVVKVRWYSDVSEYVCEVTDAGKRRDGVDYYTSDKADALATATEMCGFDPVTGRVL